jgi:flavodoxin
MKTLIVFYSFEGSTRLIAQSMAQEIQADLLELVVDQPPGPKGFMKYLWGGRQVMMKAMPRLRALDKNPADYQRLIIGTPVWAFSFVPALKFFLKTQSLCQKNIALFCCHAGYKAHTFRHLAQALKGNNLIGQIDFIEPIKNNTSFQQRKAQDWVRSLISVA